MRLAVTISISAFLLIAGAGADSFYSVEPNKSQFPLPYELPKLDGGSHADFDWAKYIGEARSEADAAFRRHIKQHGIGWPFADKMISLSKGGERMLCGHASKEFKAKCDSLIEKYRGIAEDRPAVLVKINTFFERYEAAMELQMRIVGGPRASMIAYLNYWRNLEALQRSYDLQS